jgi:hypothetical protein
MAYLSSRAAYRIADRASDRLSENRNLDRQTTLRSSAYFAWSLTAGSRANR